MAPECNNLKQIIRFLISDERQRQGALSFINGLAVPPGFLVEVVPKGRRRSAEQNARLWALYRRILPQLGMGSLDPADFHEGIMQMFLDPITVTLGDRTFEYYSSSKLSPSEFSVFMTEIEAWAVDQGAVL